MTELFGLAMPCNTRWICCIHKQWFFKCFAYAVNCIHCSICAFMHASNSSVSIWLTHRQISVSLTTQINFPPLAEKLQFVNRPSKSVLCKMDHKACSFHMTFISKNLHLTRVSLSRNISGLIDFLSRVQAMLWWCQRVASGAFGPSEHLQTAASVQPSGDWLWQTFKQYTTKYSGLQHYQKMS